MSELFDVRFEGEDCECDCAAFMTGNERERIERGWSECEARRVERAVALSIVKEC